MTHGGSTLWVGWGCQARGTVTEDLGFWEARHRFGLFKNSYVGSMGLEIESREQLALAASWIDFGRCGAVSKGMGCDTAALSLSGSAVCRYIHSCHPSPAASAIVASRAAHRSVASGVMYVCSTPPRPLHLNPTIPGIQTVPWRAHQTENQPIFKRL